MHTLSSTQSLWNSPKQLSNAFTASLFQSWIHLPLPAVCSAQAFQRRPRSSNLTLPSSSRLQNHCKPLFPLSLLSIQSQRGKEAASSPVQCDPLPGSWVPSCPISSKTSLLLERVFCCDYLHIAPISTTTSALKAETSLPPITL